MINVKIFIEDYETNDLIAEELNFLSVREAQDYINDYNIEQAYTTIRVANVYENGNYIGKISQNGRFWLKNSKYGDEFILQER